MAAPPLLGLPLIESFGKSGEAAPWPDRFLFTHKGRWPTGTDPNLHKFKGCAVRSARFRFVNDKALYDMLADPGQKTNVIEEYPEVAAEMRAAYEAWWDQTLPMMVNEKAPMSKTKPFFLAFKAQEAEGGIPEWKPAMPAGGDR